MTTTQPAPIHHGAHLAADQESDQETSRRHKSRRPGEQCSSPSSPQKPRQQPTRGHRSHAAEEPRPAAAKTSREA